MDRLDRELKEWGLTEPPYFVVCRSSSEERRGGGPNQNESICPGSGREEAVGMVFSSRALAEKFIRKNKMKAGGWKVGELPHWRHVVGFIESYPVLNYLCADAKSLSSTENYLAVDISIMLPVLRELALRDSRDVEPSREAPPPGSA